MRWLTLTAILVLPPAALLASGIPHPAPPARLPRLIEEPKAADPVLGNLFLDARARVARE